MTKYVVLMPSMSENRGYDVEIFEDAPDLEKFILTSKRDIARMRIFYAVEQEVCFNVIDKQD